MQCTAEWCIRVQKDGKECVESWGIDPVMPEKPCNLFNECPEAKYLIGDYQLLVGKKCQDIGTWESSVSHLGTSVYKNGTLGDGVGVWEVD